MFTVYINLAYSHRYLESVKPILSEGEFRDVAKVCFWGVRGCERGRFLLRLCDLLPSEMTMNLVIEIRTRHIGLSRHERHESY